MKSSGILAGIVSILVILLSTNLYSDVIWGIEIMDNSGWDFSEQMSVPGSESDIFLAIVIDPPLGLRVAAYMPPALVAEITDSTFEELKYAPEDTSVYEIDAPASIGRVYVSKTMEGHYAKFRFLSLDWGNVIIEYVYQPDGSRRLFDPTATEACSWSRIKALYK